MARVLEPQHARRVERRAAVVAFDRDRRQGVAGVEVGDRVIIAARAVNSLGARSDETLITHTVAGDTTAPANATGLAYTNVVGGMRVTWAEPGESDYLNTEVRQGASWAAGALLWIGRASNFVWTPPLDGSYTLWVAHSDRSGNESTPVSLVAAYTAVGASSGANSATVNLYQREGLGVAPALPSVTLTYDYATGSIIAGSTAGWSTTPPAASGGRYLWWTHAQAYSSTGTDTIAPGEWAAAQIMTRDGTDGEGAFVTDPGFEVAAGLTPWTLGASGSIVASGAYQGAQCLQVADTSGSTDVVAASNRQFFAVTGSTYRFGGYFKQGSPTPNGQLQFGILWRNGAGTEVPPRNVFTVSPSPVWTGETFQASPPLNAVTGELIVQTNFQTTGKFLVDAMTLEPSGADGAPGATAKTVRLSASSQVFSVSEVGAGSPSSITFTANGQNVAGSASFTVVAGSATLTGSGSTRTLTYANLATDSATVRVTWDSLVDEITVQKVYAGRSGITPILSNALHGLPADSAGNVASYTGSGTTLQVYEGGTLLEFNTTLANGRFTMGTPTVSPPGSITPGARSGSGTTTCTVADHAGATSGTSVILITYPIVCRRFNGTDVAFNLVQTINVTRKGDKGDTGSTGAAGQRGSINVSRLITGSTWSDSEANAAVLAAGYGLPQTLDLCTLYNAAGTFSEVRVYSAGSWITYAARVDGNLLVLGTITTDKLVANAVTAAQAGSYAVVDESYTSLSTWALAAATMATLTVTGAPLKLLGWAKLSLEINAFGTAAAFVDITVTLSLPGGTPSTKAFTARRAVSDLPSLSAGIVEVHIPLVWRYQPTAASRTFTLAASAALKDAIGNPASKTGKLSAEYYLVAEENKV